jgi:hypothetical protein
MRGRGLAKGGSLDNALVFRGGVPINGGGLRFDDEVARHKVREIKSNQIKLTMCIHLWPFIANDSCMDVGAGRAG